MMKSSHPSITTTHQHGHGLARRIGLPSAVVLNMMDMIGVGPFLTLPLVIAAAGSRFAVWAWILGAAIAVADGLVCAELGAAFPRAGGSYAFLREIYGPEGAGRWISFLYVWQLGLSAPLSIASGCIGLATFLAFLWPPLAAQPLAAIPFLHGTNLAAAGTCIAVVAMLYRNMTSITKAAWVLFGGVLLTITLVISSGAVAAGHNAAAGTSPWQLSQLTPSFSSNVVARCSAGTSRAWQARHFADCSDFPMPRLRPMRSPNEPVSAS